MNTKNVLPQIILSAMLLFIPGARAQIVNDGVTISPPGKPLN